MGYIRNDFNWTYDKFDRPDILTNTSIPMIEQYEGLGYEFYKNGQISYVGNYKSGLFWG